MSAEILSLLLRANLTLAAAILFVLLVRAPVRRAFGARIAYALWLMPLLATAMCFLPSLRVMTVTTLAPPTPLQTILPISADLPPAPNQPLDLALLALGIWIGGVVLMLAVLALRQWRFAKALGHLTPRPDWGERVFSAHMAAGPALVGVFKPVIVAPADFDARYSAEERRIILAHERGHMAQGDPLINALAALLQCLSWFNPLVHVAAKVMRTDQELACDAAVLARGAAARLYAQALIKTRIAEAPAPMGCAWPAPTPNEFKERILMLKSTLPSRMQILAGASAIAITTASVCAIAWAAQPPRVVRVVGDIDIEEARQAARESERHADLAGGPIDGSEDSMSALARLEAQRGALEAAADSVTAQRDSARAALESQQAQAESAQAARESDAAALQSVAAEAAARSQDTARQVHAELRAQAAALAAVERGLAARERGAAAHERADLARERMALDQARHAVAQSLSAMSADAQANVNVDVNINTNLHGGPEGEPAN